MALTPKALNAGNSGTGTNATIGVVVPAWLFASNDHIVVYIVIAATGVTVNTTPTGFSAVTGPTGFGGGATHVLYDKAATSADAGAQTTFNFVIASAARWAWVARVYSDVTSVEVATPTTGSGATSIPVAALTGLTRADDREVAFYGTRPATGATDTLTAPPGFANAQTTTSTNGTSNNAAAGAADRPLYGVTGPAATAGHAATSFLRCSVAAAIKRSAARPTRVVIKNGTLGNLNVNPATQTSGGILGTGALITGRPTVAPWRPTPPTVTRWISSNGTGNGLTAGAPAGINTFRTSNGAGMVVGLYGPNSGFGNGIYSITSTRSFSGGGSAGNPAVFRAVDPADPPVIQWDLTTTAPGGSYCFQLVTGTNYIDFYDIQFNGGNGSTDPLTWATSGIRIGDNNAVANNHHIGVYGCRMWNLAAAGVSTGPCDYLNCVGNLIHHFGYDATGSWSSGISLWESYFSDATAGFHSILVGNIISGGYDAQNNTDGNGIIVDLRFDTGAGGNPPVLIANNVLYGNGGDGIIATGSADIWSVHNTIWKNGLDPAQAGPGITAVTSSAQTLPAARAHMFNNAVQTWPANTREPFYFDATAQTTGVLKGNINAGVGNTFPSSWQDNVRTWKVTDLGLTNPPSIPDTGTTLYSTISLLPWQVTHHFVPRADSPLAGQAMDVRAHADATTAYTTGLNAWVARDIIGNTRDQATSPPVGAYAITTGN